METTRLRVERFGRSCIKFVELIFRIVIDLSYLREKKQLIVRVICFGNVDMKIGDCMQKPIIIYAKFCNFFKLNVFNTITIDNLDERNYEYEHS